MNYYARTNEPSKDGFYNFYLLEYKKPMILSFRREMKKRFKACKEAFEVLNQHTEEKKWIMTYATTLKKIKVAHVWKVKKGEDRKEVEKSLKGIGYTKLPIGAMDINFEVTVPEKEKEKE